MMTPKPPTGAPGSGAATGSSLKKPPTDSAGNAVEIGRMARTHGLRVFVNLDAAVTSVIFEDPETLKSRSTLCSPDEAVAMMTGYYGGGKA